MGAMAWANLLSDEASEMDSDVLPSSLSYSPLLVGSLNAEHRGLLKRFGELQRMVTSSRFNQIPYALSALKSKFNVHNLRKNLNLYGWVERRLTDKPQLVAALKAFHAENDMLSQHLLDFVEKYRTTGVSSVNTEQFMTGLRSLGAMLVERFQREEKEVFPLYKP